MSLHTHTEQSVTRSQISRADLLSLRVAGLAERRIEIAAVVESQLSAWTGDLADAFAAHWDEWSQGATQVIDALAASSSTLRHTNAQILEAHGCVPRPRTEHR